MPNKRTQQDRIIETIRENYVSALIGLIIVVLGIGYVYNTIKNRTNLKNNQAAQEEVTEQSQQGTISGRTYKVQKGDTLWNIAERKYQSGFNYVDIVTANKLKSANSIEVGQNLTLPDVPSKKITVGKITPTALPTATKAPTPSTRPTEVVKKPTPTTPITINGNSYAVVKGDHLWGIAVRAYGDGYKWVDIWRANRKMIMNPNLIYPGQKFILPR
ncbi:hypothetical protein A2690_01315 [Candidatus Roizmanbacteria bacterium RIFCSPHIGHO2_01_FULL_39_12b]|uniref:LysM domain-containing protein n=1 Tax=Candidatus Roizmanbacteria bacterium RIFCSPHIGHO2_01_FULL_39_12b TaxID=1802030 RepID=A0A1F7GAW0_9BACT|nr:MAG: hypothetical protein A2690_01315 [Candidatus Roizmanbacteria bacterium RIFCSPHIGHO2_01_FULL_39_12b]OGK46080.1 MAG: hypothetical protein A3B46_01220 [Candidatus Roizmanbacteria bacterium RIFCSPLOWO2_01_FULL_39_19]